MLGLRFVRIVEQDCCNGALLVCACSVRKLPCMSSRCPMILAQRASDATSHCDAAFAVLQPAVMAMMLMMMSCQFCTAVGRARPASLFLSQKGAISLGAL